MRLVVPLLLLALAVGCSHHEDRAAVVPGAPAGDVTEVAGEVSATRADQHRALHVGDVVAGDDVVKTGADGRVTIVLRHNQVAWSLGPDKENQVSDSAAWAAAKGAAAETVADDHSAAAGRHAERSATDTGESAVAPPPTMQPPPQQPETTIPLGQIGTMGHGAGGGSGDGFGNGHGSLGGGHVAHAPKLTPRVSVTGGIPAEVATRIVRQNLGRFRLCYENELRNDPTASGRVIIEAAIAATGDVTSSAVASSTVAGDLGACIARGVNGLSFPSAAKPWALTIAIALAPGD